MPAKPPTNNETADMNLRYDSTRSPSLRALLVQVGCGRWIGHSTRTCTYYRIVCCGFWITAKMKKKLSLSKSCLGILNVYRGLFLSPFLFSFLLSRWARTESYQQPTIELNELSVLSYSQQRKTQNGTSLFLHPHSQFGRKISDRGFEYNILLLLLLAFVKDLSVILALFRKTSR